MKFLMFFITLLIYCRSYSQFININNYTKNTYQTTFYNNNANEFYIEVTPWVVKGGWYQYFLTTNFTGMWSTTKSLATPYNEDIYVGSGNSYGPHWILSSSHWWDGMISPNYLNNPSYIYHQQWMNYHWRRNYNGIFSAHVLQHSPTNQQIMYAVSHGENRNERVMNYCYQNTVNPGYLINCNDPNTWSGTTDGIHYKNHWESYFGFLNGNWIPYTAAYDWGNSYLSDLGPIAWPSAGYLNSDNSQASTGLRHPSSIVDGGFVYVFVRDESMDGTGGVKLIRAAINDLLIPSSYQTWSVNGWIPSLPPGFNKDQAANFFKTRGPQNKPVFSTPFNTVRFAVAKFKNTNEYIGVEQYNASETSIRVALRFSNNLINWSEPIDIYESNNWDGLTFKYPIFLSIDGISNTEIDKEEFYIVGVQGGVSGGGQRISKMHFKYYTPPPPPPPDPCDPYQLYSVSPIPTTNIITISKIICPEEPVSGNDAHSIEVFDMYGNFKKGKKNIFLKNQYLLDVSDLNTGNYIIQITSRSGKITKQIRINK